MKRSIVTFIMIAVLAVNAMGAVGDVWNAKTQWSNTFNPRTLPVPPYGAWSYRHGNCGYLLLKTSAPYTVGWSVDGAGNVPNLYNVTISSQQQANEFGGHGPWAVTWESPVDGYVAITGSILQLYEVTRRMKYQLRYNGVPFAEGLVPEDASGNTIVAHPNGLPANRNGLVTFGPIVVWVNTGDTITYQALGAGTDEGGNGVATFVVSSFVLEQVENISDWDAKTDWNDASNPNSPWSYHDASDNDLLLATSAGAGGSPGGWSQDGTSATVPNLFDDTWGSVQQSNEFGGHGSWLVRWTSPYSGLIRVNGSLLQLFEPARRMKYQLRQNSAVISEGLIPEDGSGNTLIAYPSGLPANRDGLVTFGPLDITVNAGDRLELAAVAGSTAEGGNDIPTFVYSSFHIEPLGALIPPANILGDINRDDTVNLADLAEFALRWLEGGCVLPGCCGGCDIDCSGRVDSGDFSYISANWLQSIVQLHHLGYVVISPNGPGDGGDFGPCTQGTQTAGWQEAINYAVANKKDVYVYGGGMPAVFMPPVMYSLGTTLYIPSAENFRINGGDYLLGFSNTNTDCIVFDSQKNCDFDLGCIVAGAIQDGKAIIKIKPQTARPDGQIGFSNCSFLVNFFVGSGSVWGGGVIGHGTAWEFDGSVGPIENSRFTTMEINACDTGFILKQGTIRNNVFECPFDHITNNMLVVNSGTYNKFDIMLNPGGVGGSVIGANINGGQQNIYTLWFNGFGSETAIIWGPNAEDNIVYAMSLPMSGVVNNSVDGPGTNKIVTLGTVGFGVSTPAFPPSGVYFENRTSLLVIATIVSPGTVSIWEQLVRGDSWDLMTINAGLRTGQEIYLEPGDWIMFSYTSAPSWTWRAVR